MQNIYSLLKRFGQISGYTGTVFRLFDRISLDPVHDHDPHHDFLHKLAVVECGCQLRQMICQERLSFLAITMSKLDDHLTFLTAVIRGKETFFVVARKTDLEI
jgi:hypothetical protein